MYPEGTFSELKEEDPDQVDHSRYKDAFASCNLADTGFAGIIEGLFPETSASPAGVQDESSKQGGNGNGDK